MILMDARAPGGPHNGSPQPRFCKLPANITILALSLYSIPYFIQLFIHSLAPQYELLVSFPQAQQLSKNLTDFFWREGLKD